MTRLAIIGPGRLGTSLARRWVDVGVEFVGFVGRNPRRLESALAFVGKGERLAIADCVHADTVMIAVGDEELAGVVAACADAVREGSLWFHSSGYHDVDVLASLAARGARIGALHPLCPIPDATVGVVALAGAPASVAGAGESLVALTALAELAGLVPLSLAAGADRRRYHAACALAANGATALHAVAVSLIEAGLDAEDAHRAVSALMGRAIELCDRLGARDALSGPVLRGDQGVVSAHLAALEGDAAEAAYRALMTCALELARQRGLPDDRADAVRALLAAD